MTTNSQQPLTGITMLVFALFLFAVQDVIIKSFSDQYSVLQIVYVRAAVGVSIVFLILGVRRTMIFSRSRRPLLAWSRGFLGFASYVGYYMAIAALPLAELVAIVFTAPIFVTALSALLLKEQVGVRRWSAVIVGFIGLLIVVGPSDYKGDLAVLLAVGASITYATSTIITRFLSAHDNPTTISIYAMLAFLVGSSVLSLVTAVGSDGVAAHPSLQFFVRPWEIPTPADLGLMVLVGVNWSVGMYLLARSYSTAPASLLSPFEYSYIIWAVLFGYIFWSEVPAATTLIGVSILIGSSVYIARREMQIHHRTQNSEPAVALGSVSQQH